MKKKGLIMLLALVLLVGGAIGGTVAWLSAKTDPVVNTFTTSGIDITLKETSNNYKMVPGHTIRKDPIVTVLKGSEKCYLFVELKKSENFDDYLEFEFANSSAWTQGDGTNIPSNVYYRVVNSSSSNQPFAILKNDTVTVKNTVTNDMMEKLTENTYPTLTVTAYASQYYKSNSTFFTPEEAWAVLNP